MARRRYRGRLPGILVLASLALASLGGCVAAVAAACVGVCAAATGVAVLAAREPVATLTLEVEGLGCVSCPEGVRDALRKLDGVEDAQVNAPEKRVTVAYVPSKATREQLIEAVNGLGYSAKLAADTAGVARAENDSGGRHDENPKP